MSEVNFDDVINKFNYPKGLSEFLRKIFECFVIFYGEENKDQIFAAFYNTRIILTKDSVYNELIKCGFNINDDSIVDSSALKKAAGAYHSEPVLIKDYNGYDIEKVNRAVVVLESKNKTSFMATLIHELAHMIKSFPHEYEISGNRLLSRSGLIRTEEELTYDGTIHRHLATEKGVGLEEGLNTLEEEEIMNLLVDSNYKSSAYVVLKEIAGKFRDNLGLGKIFREAQFGKDSSLLQIDSELYEKMLRLFDEAYSEYLNRFTFDEEERKKHDEKLKEIVLKKLLVVYKKLKESLCQNYQKSEMYNKL